MKSNTIGLEHIFHALSDRSRLNMVERLSLGPLSVKELAEPLSMALPSVLKHLKVLEEGGIVVSEKSGRVRTYRLDPAQLSSIDSWMAKRKAAWNKRFDKLESFLIESSDENSDGT
ncbi:ArsR family transcriptional regulator [Leptospira congkakensis]|uniref:ArsR family transcriptional regulator n=1 Tax=Leptospira congkakensis TaxID=2484932 RepID=A0A4Z1A5A9_9LEPT|nr:metalloregulator ArsR/SmtB family transcription factor [Leptospira congkakensis]TGL87163.1 ArsR family transcriptional regulator [Leptospira congkakensis]TGL96731.1 ArsR family transcriptional regulator [Leptospira congkakensis]TGL97580.1 ArsR family transcriptional regulator [Leptospira congkakensis]